VAFSVSSNVAALNVYNYLGVHQAKASASLARISSGLKAAGGGDIASQGTAATINAALQATQSSISQVQSAINQLQAADSAYGELIDLGQKGLDVAGGLTDSGADTSALGTQMTAITAGITSIQTNTLFNGAVFTTASAPDVGVSTFTATPTVTTAPSANTVAAYTAYIAATVDIRATNAGNLAALQNTLQVLNAVATNETAALGQAQDADIAKEMMNLTAANIMTEAATAMLAQAMQLPTGVLNLLK
jgi:flagellin